MFLFAGGVSFGGDGGDGMEHPKVAKGQRGTDPLLGLILFLRYHVIP